MLDPNLVAPVRAKKTWKWFLKVDEVQQWCESAPFCDRFRQESKAVEQFFGCIGAAQADQVEALLLEKFFEVMELVRTRERVRLLELFEYSLNFTNNWCLLLVWSDVYNMIHTVKVDLRRENLTIRDIFS